MYKENKSLTSPPQRQTMTETTRDIRVDVDCYYIQELSEPFNQVWYFGADITLTNNSNSPIHVVGHDWVITDASGDTERHQSDENQSQLNPKESFTYAAECELGTPFGAIEGYYSVLNLEGEEFRVKIPPTLMTLPFAVN